MVKNRQPLLINDFEHGSRFVCPDQQPVAIHSLLSVPLMLKANIPPANDLLSRVYQQQGKVEKTISEYEHLLNLIQENKSRFLVHPRYHYRLAKLYEQKGWPGKAIEQYKKFLHFWKNADADLPEQIEAKGRYTKLAGAQ